MWIMAMDIGGRVRTFGIGLLLDIQISSKSQNFLWTKLHF